MDNTQKLLNMKKVIAQAELDNASAEGKLEEQMKVLQLEFKCSTEAKGESELKQIRKERTELQSDFDDGVELLENDYVW